MRRRISLLFLIFTAALKVSSSSGIGSEEPLDTGLPSPCLNLDSNCMYWAEQGECRSNARYMHQHCALACGTCQQQQATAMILEDGSTRVYAVQQTKDILQSTSSQHNEIDDDFIPYRLPNGTVVKRVPVGGDLGEHLGVLQYAPDEYRSLIVARLNKAQQYMTDIVEQDDYFIQARPLCKNKWSDCALRAIHGQCEDDVTRTVMTRKCAPVCHSCDQVHISTRCPLPHDIDEQNFWKPGDLNKAFERIVADFGETYNVTVLSSPPGPGEDRPYRPWIVTLENFITPDEASRLIELADQEGYERSEDWGDENEDGTYGGVVNSGRTSSGSFLTRPSNEQDPYVQAIRQRIVDVTGFPVENSAPFQVLRYNTGEYFKNHHDCVPFFAKRPFGMRALTVYFYLSDVEEGGETDFPDVNVTVKPKLGRAIIWPSVIDSEPFHTCEDLTMHQSLEVTKGMKYGSNAWIHQRTFYAPEQCM